VLVSGECQFKDCAQSTAFFTTVSKLKRDLVDLGITKQSCAHNIFDGMNASNIPPCKIEGSTTSSP